MIKKTLWVCDKCNQEFMTEEAALAHESSHIVDIVDIEAKGIAPSKFKLGDIVKRNDKTNECYYKVLRSYVCTSIFRDYDQDKENYSWKYVIGYDSYMKPISVDEEDIELVMKNEEFLDFFNKIKSIMQEHGLKSDDYELSALVDLYGLGM